jgi:hypothetical protein
MSGWEDYGGCCRLAAARDPGAVFCPECAHRLFKCPAPGCGALVTPLGHCTACIDPRLSLEKGAVLQAKVGECLSVPFVLRNGAVSRPLSIRTVLRDGAGLAPEPVPLAWEQLEAGRTRAFTVTAGPFAHGGLERLRLTIVATASLGEIEETYAFSGDLAIQIEGADPTRVVQTFNLAGANFGTAGMVVANPHASSDSRNRRGDPLATRTDVVLERAERYEIQSGCRGYDAPGARMARDVEFQFAGFPPADAPPDGPLLPGPALRCGRNSRARDGATNASPNDLCLRIYDGRSGNLDREASAAVSRRACDFLLSDDRLYVRAAGENGLAVNGERCGAGERRVVKHGDAFTVPPGPRKGIVFGVSFRVSGGLVTHVRFEKTP